MCQMGSVWQYKKEGLSIIGFNWFTVTTKSEIPTGTTAVRELKDGDVLPELTRTNADGNLVVTRANLSGKPAVEVLAEGGLPAMDGAVPVISRVIRQT